MTVSNKAAWLPGPRAQSFEVRDAPTPTPGPHDIVIRNYATAINPYEVIMHGGMLIDSYPSIIGSDIAGEVESVGEFVTRFQKGDRVIAMADGTDNVLKGTLRDTARMAFQLYVTTSEKVAAKLPSGIDYVHGCVLPLAVSTAAVALFQKDCLGLSHPQPQFGTKRKNQCVLIWGASGSVGTCAVQLALAAGYDVAATAGAKNLESLYSLGAKFVFDHRSKSVVKDLVSNISGQSIAGGFCAVWNDDAIVSTAQALSQLSEVTFVQTVMSPGVPAPANLPKDFKVGTVFASTLKDNEVGDAVWVDWISPALESGTLKCKPEPEVVGQGLAQLQVGIDRAKAGVSAKKIVVEIS